MNVTFVNRMMGIRRGGGEFFDLNMARALRSLGVSIRFVVGRRRSRIDEPLDEFRTQYLWAPYLRGIEYGLGNTRSRILRSVRWRARWWDTKLWDRVAFKQLRNDTESDIFQLCNRPALGARLASVGKQAVVRWTGPVSERAAAEAGRCSGSFAHGLSYEEATRYNPDTHYVVAGCDTELFCPPPGKLRIQGACRFLFVGRCIAVKNLEFLIRGFAEAVKHRPALHLRIVGEGESVPALQGLVRCLGIQDKVEFPGFQSGTALARQYQWADCFVLVSKIESFSLVALEAMSSGLPLVLTRVGHLPTFVNEYAAGTLVESDNGKELVDALIYWADHADLRERMEAGNRRTVVERFSWRASAERLLAYYESILAAKEIGSIGGARAHCPD